MLTAILCSQQWSQVAQLWQRVHATSAFLTGWVILMLNFRLKGYISHQYLWTVRWGNGYTTIMLLDVFTQRNFVADIIRWKLNIIKKITKNQFLSHPLGDLGVTYALYL